MKKLLLVLALVAPLTSQAYQTIVGADPSVTPDKEYKSAQKSITSGYSDAITGSNELLSYDYVNTPAGGYSVSRVGGGGTTNPEGATLIMGVGTRTVATGDLAYFLVQTRGYATVKYDATVAITRGVPVCANSVGAAVRCSGFAASASKVIPLETKSSGTGTDLKVLLNGS